MKRMKTSFLAIAMLFTLMTSTSATSFSANSSQASFSEPTQATFLGNTTLPYQNTSVPSDFGAQPRGSRKGVVLEDHVNIRSGMGTEYPSLGQMNKGDTVWMNWGNDLWTYCLCDSPNKGVYGYLWTAYIKQIEP